MIPVLAITLTTETILSVTIIIVLLKLVKDSRRSTAKYYDAYKSATDKVIILQERMKEAHNIVKGMMSKLYADEEL